jgi:hypothetical protein
MKFVFSKLLIICLILASIVCRSSRSKLKTHSKTKSKAKTETNTHLKTTYWVRPLINTAQNYSSFANLPYCPGDVISKLACPLCDKLLDNSFEVFKYYKHKVGGYTFTFVILFSTNRNEVVVSFSGPKAPHPAFYSTIYSRGMKDMVGQPDILIETTYLDVYEGKFQKKLFAYIQDYNDKFNVEENNHKYVFVGHNFGGALAVLAAFDMAAKKAVPVKPQLDSPIVYSYGQLRIGNNVFVNQANALFKIVRIVKSGDVYPRMPSCSWSPSINKFRCEEEWDYSHIDHTTTKPELLNYIQNYYGKNGGLQSGLETNYGSFLEKSNKKKQPHGWSYSANNPGYKVNNLGDPFDQHGNMNDDGKITYSQPLGAEVMFTNNFKKHKICSYFYGIPNCEKGISPEYDKNVGKNYFNSDLTDC